MVSDADLLQIISVAVVSELDEPMNRPKGINIDLGDERKPSNAFVILKTQGLALNS